MRLASIPDVPYLDVVAARNETGDKLTLFCVNRHLTRDIAAHISIAGFSPAEDARVQTLSASSIYDKNDDAHPEAVAPRESRLRLEAAELGYSFQHESVTVLDFHKRN